MLVLPAGACAVHGGTFFGSDDDGVCSCKGWEGVSPESVFRLTIGGEVRDRDEGGEGGREGNVPRKPAKAGRNDFAAAGIVVCVMSSWLVGW
jgi:hypothetical protein